MFGKKAMYTMLKLSIIIELIKSMDKKLHNIIPGEILLLDYMKPLGLSQNALAHALGVPPRRVNEIVHGKRATPLDTSERLGRFFRQSPNFWLNLELECNLRRSRVLIDKIMREVRPYSVA